MGRDRPKSLDNLSQDLIAVTAGAAVMQVVALEFISAIEGNDWLSIRVVIHKQQPTVFSNKKQPNLKGQ